MINQTLKFITLGLVFSSALSCAHRNTNLVIDSGHDITPPLRRGALGTCGKAEVEYNDEVTPLVIAEFQKDPAYNLVLTREPGKDIDLARIRPFEEFYFLYTKDAQERYKTKPDSISLLARPILANRFSHPQVHRPPESNRPKCDIFISIHHDSTANHRLQCEPKLCTDRKAEFQGVQIQRQEILKSLKPGEAEPASFHPCGRTEEALAGGGGSKLTPEFYKEGFQTGYTILVYGNEDPDRTSPDRRNKSLALAKSVSIAMQASGKQTPQGPMAMIGGQERPVANHHTTAEEKHDFRSFGPEYDALGIIHRDVAVLREVRCPAILIEVGNIADSEDEKKITSPEFRADLVRRIKAGVDAWRLLGN